MQHVQCRMCIYLHPIHPGYVYVNIYTHIYACKWFGYTFVIVTTSVCSDKTMTHMTMLSSNYATLCVWRRERRPAYIASIYCFHFLSIRSINISMYCTCRAKFGTGGVPSASWNLKHSKRMACRMGVKYGGELHQVLEKSAQDDYDKHHSSS